MPDHDAAKEKGGSFVLIREAARLDFQAAPQPVMVFDAPWSTRRKRRRM